MPASVATSPADPETLCTEHLAWARGVLRKRLGPDAEQHAGAGLFEAARTYDPGKGPFRSWAVKHLIWAAKGEYQRERKHAGASELLDGDAEASLPAMEHAGLERRESMLRCLKSVDAIAAPARWVVLCRFMGSMDNQQIAKTLNRHHQSIPRLTAGLRQGSAQPEGDDGLMCESDERQRSHGQGHGPMLFDSLDAAVDAAMLFGGQIVTNTRSSMMPRLAIGRGPSRWAALAWAVVVLERNGLRMSPTIGGEQAVYRTKATNLLAGSMRRWYAVRHGRRMPEGIEIDRPKLAFWLVDAISRSAAGGSIMLTMPGMSARKMARAIRDVADLEAEPATTAQGQSCVAIPAEARDRAEAWLEPLAPVALLKPARPS